MKNSTLKHPKIFSRLHIFLGLLLLHGASFAEDYGITASELQMMPKVCRTLHAGHYAPDAQKLMIPNALPKNMPAVHHFCQGLKFMFRADKAKSKQHKGFNISNAISNFDYVLEGKGSKPSDPKYNPAYLSQVHYFKAEALKRNNEYPQMISEYMESIRLKPDIPSSYARLFDYYVKIGDQEEARKIIEAGIKNVPKADLLKKRRDSLNNKK